MHRSRILATLGTIIGLGLALMPPAGAAEDMDPTVVVLDASGSMLQKDVGGQTRMDAAKQATTEFMSEAPKDAQLGLVTYGTGTGSSDAEKEAGCRDITVLAKPGEKPSDALKNEVNGLQPRGYTPIGNSLLKANELLPKDGKRSIVLVSDGIAPAHHHPSVTWPNNSRNKALTWWFTPSASWLTTPRAPNSPV